MGQLMNRYGGSGRPRLGTEISCVGLIVPRKIIHIDQESGQIDQVLKTGPLTLKLIFKVV